MKNKGFTLVEVLVSVALLGIVAIILAKFFQYNEIINEQTKFNQTKLYEAQDIMEKRISSIN
ncbi:MAG: prepilin-type N-terminal cleavage/methylation domain-containing protein, partial [Oscillospiraceae bacterium]